MRRRIIVVSLALHITLFFTMFAVGIWHLDRVEAGRLTVAIGTPLPPPPAPAGGASPSKAPAFTHKHITHDIVVPEKPPVETPATTPSEVPGNGSGGGSGSGSGSGDPNTTGPCTENCGEGSGSATIIVEKKKQERVVLPPTVLKGLRRSGETQIHPSDVVKTAMLHDGHHKVTAVYKVCVGANGNVDDVMALKASGYPEWDGQLVAAMRGWIYKPYEIDGQAVPACGAVTFSYEIE